MVGPNEQAQAGWTASAAAWVENEGILDRAFGPVTDAVLRAADLGGGGAVLDIGCGSGTLLEACARRGHQVVGVDIASPMVAAARRRVPKATVVLADAQTADLGALPGAPFDRVVSRFGVMFFADPRAAFANIRAATAPHARLTFVCWRGVEENLVFTLGTRVLTAVAGMAEPVSGERGPTAFADRDVARDVLADARWSDIAVEPLDTTLRYGGDGRDGVADRLAVVLGGETARVARQQVGEERWARVVEDVVADIRTCEVANSAVEIGAACWLVTARG